MLLLMTKFRYDIELLIELKWIKNIDQYIIKKSFQYYFFLFISCINIMLLFQKTIFANINDNFFGLFFSLNIFVNFSIILINSPDFMVPI